MESTNLTQCSPALEHYSSPLVDLDILTPGVNICIVSYNVLCMPDLTNVLCNRHAVKMVKYRSGT